MGRIIVSEFVTLDGVIEAPGHEDHRDGKNAWALRGTSEDQQRFKVDEILAADAILVTYEARRASALTTLSWRSRMTGD